MDQKLDRILEQIESLKSTVSETRELLEPLITKVNKLEEHQEENDEKVYDLQCKIAWLEQYGMRNDIIISGLIEEREEELAKGKRVEENRATKNAVIKLAKNLDVEIEEKDIVTAHRMQSGKRNDGQRKKISNVIVRFVYSEKRYQMLAASKEKKPKNKEGGNIYCSENLSHYTWEMLYAARQYRDKGVFKHVWINDGKVMVREEEGTKASRIWSCNQLEYIVNQIRGERISRQNSQGAMDTNCEDEEEYSHKDGDKGNTIRRRKIIPWKENCAPM